MGRFSSGLALCWVLESRELNAARSAAVELNHLRDGSSSAVYPSVDFLSAMEDLHWSLSLLPAQLGIVAPISVGWLCSTTSCPAWCPWVPGCVAQLSFNPVPCLQTLPIIVFFSCVMSILYYLGVMQWLILKVGPHS